MTTFKAVVQKHRKRSDGTYNVKIRVTHNKKSRYISTVWYAEEKDLVKKTLRIKNQFYIDATDDLIRKYRKICDRAGESLASVEVDKVVELITAPNALDPSAWDLDIIKYGHDYADFLERTGHRANALSYRVALNNLSRFVGRDCLSVHAITTKFVNDWISWIAAQPAANGDRKRGTRAQSLYPGQIRAIFNRAKKEYNDEDMGIIRIPRSPFAKVEMPKIEARRKRALTPDQVRQIARLEYKQPTTPHVSRFNLARDIFLLSFGLVGMNAVDLYNCTDYKDGRITYCRTKTKNRRADHAEISIRVEPELLPLMEKYRDPSGDRVFNFYSMYSTDGAFSIALNIGLKEIGKLIGEDCLQFYAARHSWATIATNNVKVDKYTVHTALNHVDEKMRVTDMYIMRDWSIIDDANRKVMDYMQLEIGDCQEPRFVSRWEKKAAAVE